MPTPRATPQLIVGIDLAWGDRNPDGVCVIEATPRRARVRQLGLTYGDAELLSWFDQHVGNAPALVMVDAPIVCPNLTGTRPVDRLTHVHFGRYKCGCYPANLTKCPRPPRVAAALVERGLSIGWELNDGVTRLVAEVYPHPAMVRLFDLTERVPYKKGTVVQRRREFRRLQKLIQQCLAEHFPRLELDEATEKLLAARWTKNVEDQTDGFFCALIGYWHWLHRGRRTQVLGDRETGFIVIPQP
jgi:predicted RNase H-like nuclease